MNKFFKKYNLSVSSAAISKLSRLTVNLQGADENTIVFYRLADSDEAFNKFLNYKKNTKPGLIILNREIEHDIGTEYVVVEDFTDIQKDLCDYLYPDSNNIKIIGVTGTNGKSSVVHLCQKILNSIGEKAFSIGTVGVYSDEKEIAVGVGTTTPSYIDLRRILHENGDYKYACIELSSHALIQKRIGELKIEVIGWTNFSQDHLDYHSNMEEYFEAKLLIQDVSNNKLIISNGEFELENELVKRGKEFEVATEITAYDGDDCFRLSYNKKNLSLAKALCEKLLGKTVGLPSGLTLPKGRYNTYHFNKSIFVVDYAHSPDALYNVLKETAKAFSGYNIIALFGCGGDRDRDKRPKMLDACLEFCHSVIVTTDNPRTEAPEAIIDDILAEREFEEDKVVVIVSRKEAIRKSICDYRDQTVVVIAGKGHEEYQDIGGEKHFFSDTLEVLNGIGRLENETK